MTRSCTYLVVVRFAGLKLVLWALVTNTISRDLEPVDTGWDLLIIRDRRRGSRRPAESLPRTCDDTQAYIYAHIDGQSADNYVKTRESIPPWMITQRELERAWIYAWTLHKISCLHSTTKLLVATFHPLEPITVELFWIWRNDVGWALLGHCITARLLAVQRKRTCVFLPATLLPTVWRAFDSSIDRWDRRVIHVMDDEEIINRDTVRDSSLWRNGAVK